MRPKLVPLSETMHLIMLSLLEPKHGYAIMEEVRQMSDGEVNIAAGTLYGAVENLKKNDYIEFVSPVGERKKVYGLTELGRSILSDENKRFVQMTQLYEDRGSFDD